MIGLTELFGIWYVYSNIAGASLGAITNFLLGRYWAFESVSENLVHQAGRYIIVSIGSLLLNTTGLYLLTEWTALHYIPSKIIIGILVAITYNFLMQKHFVFKK